MKKKLFLMIALLCAVVQGAWAQDEWDAVYTMTQTTSSNWTALEASSTGRTLGSADAVTYYYVTSNLSFTNATAGGSGLTILGTVYLYVPEGKTVTCTGANASGQTGGGAGIELAAGNSLYILGCGTLNANGGNAANGGNGASGGASVNEYPTDHVCSGTGGTGGNGGGGAGAGIGTRGGNGGTGGNGGAGHNRTGDGWDKANGNSGSAGTNGGTAGAMGNLYVYQALAPTVKANGGNAGSSGGTSGPGGKSQIWDGHLNWSVPAGGGGGAGGFGGAASSIGTGGPGGGGGGGGAGGGLDWKNTGYYYLCSPGGQGGQNADGSNASDGHQAEVSPTALGNGMCGSNGSWGSNDCSNSGAAVSNGTGGGRGAAGSASVGGSASTVTVDWTTQEDDWNLICLLTGSTRADWVHLADGSTKGKTLGAAGTTTYYYTAADRTFTNSNAGGSGLTILGTVYLYIPSGKTITCTGTNATAPIGGGAGIELTAGNTLYIIGSGTLNATGGNAANGSNGGAGGDADFKENEWVESGAGGKGGDGGGGAGAGIGTHGGNGGAGGAGGARVSLYLRQTQRLSGNIGNDGDNGGTAADMGTLYIYQIPALTTEIHGGSGGTSSDNGGAGGRHALFFVSNSGGYPWLGTVGGGAGGAGGGFGGAASDIGTGGPGGGGGGGGSSGSVQNHKNNTYFLLVGAFGGAPGANADGTRAGAGEETLMVDVNNLAQTNHTNPSELVKGDWGQDGAGNKYGDNRAAGGAGGTAGAASVSGSANAVTVGWPTQGKGIEDAPFIVSSTDDWNEFASYVNSGYAFSGNFVKLGDDIDISTMAGTSDANSFQGTFDGDGNTLTFTKGTSQEPFAEDYSAPFRHVKNAVIKNLHVDGSIYTSVQMAAGFVGESHGALTITNCRSSVNIHSSKSGDGTHGGFVATLSGSNNVITIDGCVFDGSFATTASTRNCGGFIGWGVNNKPTIKNSLMKPASVAANMLNNTFARWHTGYEPTIDNCYFVAAANLPTNQGTQAYAVNDAPANLGNLVQDYDALTAYANGILFDGKYYVAPASISLANAADNSTTISNANGYVANVTLTGRTLYKDGAWNTLCLPFNVNNFTGTPLEDATVMELGNSGGCKTGFDSATGTLTLDFVDANMIEAGHAYIVKWTSGDNISNPVFNGVTVVNENPANQKVVSQDGYVQFIGTYSPVGIYTDDKTNLYLGADNTLYYPTASGFKVNAFRAYFQLLNGLTAGDPGNGVRAINLNFGEGSEETIISPAKIAERADVWYTIDGVKLNGKPNVKGLYINNGRKVVIK